MNEEEEEEKEQLVDGDEALTSMVGNRHQEITDIAGNDMASGTQGFGGSTSFRVANLQCHLKLNEEASPSSLGTWRNIKSVSERVRKQKPSVHSRMYVRPSVRPSAAFV